MCAASSGRSRPASADRANADGGVTSRGSPRHPASPAIRRAPVPTRGRTPAPGRRWRWWTVTRRRRAPAPITVTMEMTGRRAAPRHAVSPAVQPPARAAGPVGLLHQVALNGRWQNRPLGTGLGVGRERTRNQHGSGNQKSLHGQTSTCSMSRSCAVAPEPRLNLPFMKRKGLRRYPRHVATTECRLSGALKHAGSGPFPALHETSKSASRRGIEKHNGPPGSSCERDDPASAHGRCSD